MAILANDRETTISLLSYPYDAPNKFNEEEELELTDSYEFMQKRGL